TPDAPVTAQLVVCHNPACLSFGGYMSPAMPLISSYYPHAVHGSAVPGATAGHPQPPPPPHHPSSLAPAPYYTGMPMSADPAGSSVRPSVHAASHAYGSHAGAGAAGTAGTGSGGP